MMLSLTLYSTSQGVPHWRVKSSGVRQSKIYKCQLALMGGKGLNNNWLKNILPPLLQSISQKILDSAHPLQD